MAPIAMTVNRAAEMRPMRSPKFRSPTARPPRMTVKLSQERKVRSLAKKTFGSTRVGRAIFLPVLVSSGCSLGVHWKRLGLFGLVFNLTYPVRFGGGVGSTW